MCGTGDRSAQDQLGGEPLPPRGGVQAPDPVQKHPDSEGIYLANLLLNNGNLRVGKGRKVEAVKARQGDILRDRQPH